MTTDCDEDERDAECSWFFLDGRPPVGDKPMTNAERNKKYRDSHPKEMKEKEARRSHTRPDPRNAYRDAEFPRHAVGIDGEGRRDPDDEQRDNYWLLQADDKDGKANIPDLRVETGYLGTFEILAWLFRYVWHPRRLVVGYGLSYDWQHWFRDLDTADYMGTFEQGPSYPQGRKITGPGGEVYFIWQIPGKLCEIYQAGSPGKKLVISDMLGWTGDPFVKTMAAWGILSEEEQKEMQVMKDLRGQFHKERVEDVIAYNRNEVIAMAKYWTALDATIQETFNIRLRSWHGGACLAKGLLRSRGIEVANDYSNEPEEVQRAIHAAFSGGRIECMHLGHFDGAWVYDINSAYPASLVLLPVGAGEFRERSDRDISNVRHGLAQVTWDIRQSKAHCPLVPFFWRDDNGNIHRPPHGKGTYHCVEVKEAIALWGSAITVDRLWEYVPVDDSHPFEFLREIYLERQKLDKQSPNKGKVLKIGPNSIYGTLAQRPRGRFKPPYRNLFLAGEVTARTRAKLLRLMAQDPQAVIYCNTDGVTFSRPLEGFVPSSELGEWSEKAIYTRYEIYKPGLAFMQNSDETWEALTRGIRKGPALASREEMCRTWEEEGFNGWVFVYMEEQFIRRRMAVREKIEKDAGKWIKTLKRVRLRPAVGCGQSVSPTFTRRWGAFTKSCDYSAPSAPYRYGTVSDARWEKERSTKAEKVTV